MARLVDFKLMHGKIDFKILHQMFDKFDEDAKIQDVFDGFNYQIVRVESPEFIDTPDGNMLPEIPLYLDLFTNDIIFDDRTLDKILDKQIALPWGTMNPFSTPIARKINGHNGTTIGQKLIEEFESFLDAEDKVQESGQCTHIWADYQGFTDNYQYCTKCDQKKL